jgi:hypothetical protein
VDGLGLFDAWVDDGMAFECLLVWFLAVIMRAALRGIPRIASHALGADG